MSDIEKPLSVSLVNTIFLMMLGRPRQTIVIPITERALTQLVSDFKQYLDPYNPFAPLDLRDGIMIDHPHGIIIMRNGCYIKFVTSPQISIYGKSTETS